VIVREISVPADPVRLARRIAARRTDSVGIAVLVSSPCGALRPEDARSSFLACDPVEASDAWVPPVGEGAPGWAGLEAAPRWMGVIPYEAGRALERRAWHGPDRRSPPRFVRPRWLRYDAVARVDHATGRVAIEADDPRAADRLARALSGPDRAPEAAGQRPLPGGEPAEAHVARVREVLHFIARGDVYQVNLARSLAFELRGRPLDVFASLVKDAPSPYGFFMHFGDAVVCGTSPELALSVRGDDVRTGPIKGTVPRGAHASEDTAHAGALDGSAKERAELTMAIDLHRNDLGRIAVPGSVRVRIPPRVIAGQAVWSRVAEIGARRAPGVTVDEVAHALLPCGSVTGAPKVRAMEIISDLEPFRRGLYTGGYGYVGRDGALVLAVAIRTLEIDTDLGVARYATGGGIVADSEPWRELEETRWKAAQVARLVAREAARGTKVGRKPEVAIALDR
jgi:anthranilate/para-aminobenzoate synthase component I